MPFRGWGRAHCPHFARCRPAPPSSPSSPRTGSKPCSGRRPRQPLGQVRFRNRAEAEPTQLSLPAAPGGLVKLSPGSPRVIHPNCRGDLTPVCELSQPHADVEGNARLRVSDWPLLSPLLLPGTNSRNVTTRPGPIRPGRGTCTGAASSKVSGLQVQRPRRPRRRGFKTREGSEGLGWHRTVSHPRKRKFSPVTNCSGRTHGRVSRWPPSSEGPGGLMRRHK